MRKVYSQTLLLRKVNTGSKGPSTKILLVFVGASDSSNQPKKKQKHKSAADAMWEANSSDLDLVGSRQQSVCQ